MPRLPGIIFIALLFWLGPVDGARTSIVDDDGFANYKTIQEAVVAASNGDTIYIKPGTYREGLILNKSLSLKPLPGEQGPIILRGDGIETGITISSDRCSLEGLTLENFIGPGIRIESSGNIIQKNRFENDNPAILISDSRMNTITKNAMVDCQGGVALWHNSTNNSVIENEIDGGVVSIFIRDTGRNSIINNRVNSSFMGVWLMNGSNNEIMGNNVSAKTYGMWIFNSSAGRLTDNILTKSTRGIYLVNSSGQEVKSNEIKDAEFGVVLENSSRNTVSDCRIENSTSAFSLAMSFANMITGNKIIEAKDMAIGLYLSSGNSLLNNEIFLGDRGIILRDSRTNHLQNNRFQNTNWSLHVESSTKEGFNNSIDESNLVNGAPIAYIYGQSGGLIQNKKLAHLTLAYSDNFTVMMNEISNDAVFLINSMDNKILENNVSSCYGMSLVNSTRNEITGNNLTDNRYSGMSLVSSNSNQIQENTASDNNQNGISLLDSSENIIRDNVADHNYETGIWLNLSNDNQIYQNNITNNLFGQQIMHSTGNAIYHNNFINNKEHSEDVDGINNWDRGNVTGGNYWEGHVAKGNPSQNWPRMIKGGKIDAYPFQDVSGWLSGGRSLRR